MKSPILAVASTALLGLLLAPNAVAQVREEKVEPKDFPSIVKDAQAAFTGKDFAKAIEHLKAAMQLAADELRKAVIAAMPAPPEGMQAQPIEQPNAAANPFAGAMVAAAVPIEHSYTGKGGKNVKISIHVKSPMVKIASMGLMLAAQSPNHEKIGYGAHEGVLETQRGGKQLQLQIILWGEHLITVVAKGLTDKELFAIINQAFVDKVAQILGK